MTFDSDTIGYGNFIITFRPDIIVYNIDTELDNESTFSAESHVTSVGTINLTIVERPVIEEIRQTPVAPNSSDNITIRTRIRDYSEPSEVNITLYLNGIAQQTSAMQLNNTSVFNPNYFSYGSYNYISYIGPFNQSQNISYIINAIGWTNESAEAFGNITIDNYEKSKKRTYDEKTMNVSYIKGEKFRIIYQIPNPTSEMIDVFGNISMNNTNWSIQIENNNVSAYNDSTYHDIIGPELNLTGDYISEIYINNETNLVYRNRYEVINKTKNNAFSSIDRLTALIVGDDWVPAQDTHYYRMDDLTVIWWFA